jgi:hypothetical protein
MSACASYVNTYGCMCVRTYVRLCVRACVRTHVRATRGMTRGTRRRLRGVAENRASGSQELCGRAWASPTDHMRVFRVFLARFDGCGCVCRIAVGRPRDGQHVVCTFAVMHHGVLLCSILHWQSAACGCYTKLPHSAWYVSCSRLCGDAVVRHRKKTAVLVA